jgi:hypothetical protein
MVGCQACEKSGKGPRNDKGPKETRLEGVARLGVRPTAKALAANFPAHYQDSCESCETFIAMLRLSVSLDYSLTLSRVTKPVQLYN